MKNNNKGFVLVEMMLVALISAGIMFVVLNVYKDMRNDNYNQVERYHVSHNLIVKKGGLTILPMFMVDDAKLSVTKGKGVCKLGASDSIESIAQFKQVQGQDAAFLYKVNSSYTGDLKCGQGTFFIVSTIAGLNVKENSAYYNQGSTPVKLLPDTPTPSAILSEAMLARTK